MARRATNHRPGRGPIVGSAAIHVGAVLLAWLTQAVEPSDRSFETLQIQLVSPPPIVSSPREEAPAEDFVVETPETEIEADPPPEPQAIEPVRKPKTEPPKAEPKKTPVEDEKKEAAVPDPDSTEAKESGEDLNVRLEGVRRDYPAYYENIVRQMKRCFRWRGGGELKATIRFNIKRDGSVSDLSVVRSSGDPRFDLEAMGAAECAGRPGRFGPLPEDLPYDWLPVEFTFEPPQRRSNGPPNPDPSE